MMACHDAVLQNEDTHGVCRSSNGIDDGHEDLVAALHLHAIEGRPCW